jgi:hypothetical protein
MKDNRFIGDLLENIGAYVDPNRLIKQLPSKTEIQGLRNKLVKIISDYNLQMSLQEGCKEILKKDCVDLQKRLYLTLLLNTNIGYIQDNGKL